MSALWNGGDVETEVALQLCVRPFSTHSHIGKILSSPVLTRKNYPAAFSQIAFSEYLANTVIIMHSETASVTWRVGLLLVQLAGPIREVSISAGTD